MRSVQHRLRLPILTLTVLTSKGGASIGAIEGGSRYKCGLRGDGMEQALLVEANTILATAIRRAIIARAANLDNQSAT